MPIYKNLKNGPLAFDTVEGDAVSVPGKGEFFVTRATELSAQFRHHWGNVRLIKEDSNEPPRPKMVVEESVVPPPELAQVPALDEPGQALVADESPANTASADAQPSDESEISDSTMDSGAVEPKPGTDATDSDDKQKSKRKRRYGRKKASDSSED
jgi:hypothetical protein